jgi:hypothetical protein
LEAGQRPEEDEMKRMLGVGVAATLALGAGVAIAHNTEYQTEVSVFEGQITKGPTGYAFGLAGSKFNEKCGKRQEIQLRADQKGADPVVIDEARTSRNGFYFLQGDFPDDYSALLLKLIKKDVGKGDHKHICSGDSELVDTVPLR